MKTIITKNIIVLCLISLMLALGACSKYEDGPWISFRSPESRLCGPKWRVVSFMKNDSDLTAQWTANYDWRFFFQSHYDSELYESSGLDVYQGDNIIGVGSWSFSLTEPYGDAYTTNGIGCGFILIDQDTLVAGIYPLQSRVSIKYKILRLKIGELWLEHSDSIQNEYVIKFSND